MDASLLKVRSPSAHKVFSLTSDFPTLAFKVYPADLPDNPKVRALYDEFSTYPPHQRGTKPETIDEGYDATAPTLRETQAQKDVYTVAQSSLDGANLGEFYLQLSRIIF